MKKLIYILPLIILFGCNSENAPDCFQNAGTIIQKEVDVAEFSTITTFKDVELFVTQGLTQKVIIETGEFLMPDIEVVVVGDRLLLKDNNSCNLTRDYGLTKIYVTTPNLTEIRNSSQLAVNSIGALNFETLTLLSEDYSDSSFYNVGNFNLEVETVNLKVVTNNITSVFASGTTENLDVSFSSGAGRFEGRFLIAQNVKVFHRGSNDIVVNPQQELEANLISTGDVISVNTPPTLSIQEQFTGRVLFE